MSAIERMTFFGDVELRMDEERGPQITGLGVLYGRYSADLGGFVEVVLPGSGTKTIMEQDIRGLFNHDPNNLLGRKNAGTLRLTTEERGIRYSISAPNTQVGNDVVELVKRGDIPGSSFGFNLVNERSATWAKSSRGYPVRQIHEFIMRDIGPVTFPAYGSTEPALRMLAEERSLPYDRVVQAARQGHLTELIEPADSVNDHRPHELHRIIKHRVFR
jgi:HK97 family phage prohead protease